MMWKASPLARARLATPCSRERGKNFPFRGAVAAVVDLLLNKALDSSARALLIPFPCNLDPIDEHIIRPLFSLPFTALFPRGNA